MSDYCRILELGSGGRSRHISAMLVDPANFKLLQ